MNRIQFIDELLNLGFSHYKTKGKLWYGAYVLHNSEQLMYILPRKNGVDVKVINETLDDFLKSTKNRILSMSTDGLTRHFFNNANCSLLDNIINIAKCFKNKTYKHDSFQPIGNSFKNNSSYLKKKQKHEYTIKRCKEDLDITYSVLGYYPQDLLDELEKLNNQNYDIKQCKEKLDITYSVLGYYPQDLLNELEQLENQQQDNNRNEENEENEGIEVIGEYSGDMMYGYHCR